MLCLMSTPSDLLRRKFRAAWPHLDERTRRIMAATEALSLGFGGVSMVSRACGLSRKAIHKGIHELEEGEPLVGRVRRPGAGRKSITHTDPELVQTLEGLIDEQTRGDPQSALRWICKSTRAIAQELVAQNHPISHVKVAQILHDLELQPAEQLARPKKVRITLIGMRSSATSMLMVKSAT
jgi:hypothetical protein